jgi:hypothetical protein
MEPYERDTKELTFWDCPGNCGTRLCSKSFCQHFKVKPKCETAYYKQFNFPSDLPQAIQVAETVSATGDDNSKAVASLPSTHTLLLSTKAFWKDTTMEQKLMLMDDKNHGEHYKKIFKDREPIWSSEDNGDEGMVIGPGSDSGRSLSPEPYLIHHGPNDSLFIPHPPDNDNDDLTDEEDDEEDDEGKDEQEDGKKKKKANL